MCSSFGKSFLLVFEFLEMSVCTNLRIVKHKVLVLLAEMFIHVILLVLDFAGCDIHKNMVYKTNWMLYVLTSM